MAIDCSDDTGGLPVPGCPALRRRDLVESDEGIPVPDVGLTYGTDWQLLFDRGFDSMEINDILLP